MSKVMEGFIGMIDNFIPGYKTYVVWVVALLMMICQMFGHHVFATETWGVVGVTGMGTWKMSQDRMGK